jgi:hypothetical protein
LHCIRQQQALRALAPRLGVPGLRTFFGGLLSICSKFSKTFFLTLPTSVPAQAPGNPLSPLVLR